MHDYFTWQTPSVLKWLWLAPVLGTLVWYAALRRQACLRVFLGAKYTATDWRWHRRRRLLKGALLVAAYCLLIVAGARPRVGTEQQEVKRHGADVVLVIDTSSSMQAQDVQPSRLEAAKQAALALINRMAGDRIGVVVFAGGAYMYSPLTIDQDAASMFVSSIERGSAPAPGTALGDALTASMRLLAKAEYSHKAIVLLSDGEDHAGLEPSSIKQARSQGIRVHVVGFGSDEGVPIPVERRQQEAAERPEDPLGLFESFFGSDRPQAVESKFKRDKHGEIVLTKVNEQMLADVAREGGGVFVRSSASGSNIDRVYQAIASTESGVVGTYEFTKYAERFQWPLGFAILLILVDAFVSAAPRRPTGT